MQDPAAGLRRAPGNRHGVSLDSRRAPRVHGRLRRAPPRRVIAGGTGLRTVLVVLPLPLLPLLNRRLLLGPPAGRPACHQVCRHNRGHREAGGTKLSRRGAHGHRGGLKRLGAAGRGVLTQRAAGRRGAAGAQSLLLLGGAVQRSAPAAAGARRPQAGAEGAEFGRALERPEEVAFDGAWCGRRAREVRGRCQQRARPAGARPASDPSGPPPLLAKPTEPGAT